MGKKSRKVRDKKTDGTKRNPPAGTTFEDMTTTCCVEYFDIHTKCVHGDVSNDPTVKKWNKRQHDYWYKQTSSIGSFAQFYLDQIAWAPDLNQIAAGYVFRNKELIDTQYVALAHATAVSEIVVTEENENEENDEENSKDNNHREEYELARFKTELAIAAQVFLDMNKNEMEFMMGTMSMMMSGGSGSNSSSPPAMMEMEQQLNSIRKSKVVLLQYLQRKTPKSCTCLDQLLQVTRSKIETDSSYDKYDSSLSGISVKSDVVGMKSDMGNIPNGNNNNNNDKNDNNNDEGCPHRNELSSNISRVEALLMIQSFACDKPRTRDNFTVGSYKDISPLIKFFEIHRNLVQSPENAYDFAAIAFGLAAGNILNHKQYETAELMTNLGLLAEVYANVGCVEEVDGDIESMMDKKQPQMKPYLLEMIMDMKDANKPSRVVRVLQKRIPCHCMDNIRAVFHSKGDDRDELCEVCWKAAPKKQFKKCSRCHIEEYCCKECQRTDWPNHRVNCKRWSSALSQEM